MERARESIQTIRMEYRQSAMGGSNLGFILNLPIDEDEEFSSDSDEEEIKIEANDRQNTTREIALKLK